MVFPCRIVTQGRHHALGVPLHAEQGCGFVYDRLDRSVVRPRGGMQAERNAVHRLMMIAVDRGRCTCQRRKARDTVHPMAAAAVPFDVLPERAAEKDIDRLACRGRCQGWACRG